MNVYTLFSGTEATGVSEAIPVLETLRTRDYNIQSIAVMVYGTSTAALTQTIGSGLDDATLSGFAESYEALDYKITVDAERAIGAATAGTGTVLDDCTSGGTYTGATDKDYVVEIDAVADIGTAVLTGTGTDDCTSGGAFTGNTDLDYQVCIDAIAAIGAATITGAGPDDCTSGGTFTGAVDTDYQVKIDAVAAVGTATQTGSGLDDCASSGTYTGPTDLTYVVEIDAEAAVGTAVITGEGLNDCTSGGAYTHTEDLTYIVEIDAIAAIGAATQTGTGTNDCVSGGTYTGSTDLDYKIEIAEEAAVGVATITGEGIDDCTSGGTYTGPTNLTYVVEVDAAAATDTFKWSKDGGSNWEVTGVAMTGAAQELDNGVTVTFTATTGHTLGNLWTIIAEVDQFMWSDDGGSTWDGNNIPITGVAQTLNNGVTVTFGTVTGHTKPDIWEFTATVDTFKWSDNGGSIWDGTGVMITGAAQTLNNGVTVTFGSATGHTLADLWTIEATVDTFKWSKDAGKTWEETGVSITTAAQNLDNGVEATFAAALGHTLGDLWTIAATVDTFTWSNNAGATWEATGVTITGAAQDLDNGVTVTFGDTIGHSLNDLWDIAATVDTFKWSDDGGVGWDGTGVSITGAAQNLNNGVTVTFGSTTGHTLNDLWDIAATVDTFKWSDNGGSTWDATGVSVTEAAQNLNTGVTVTIASAHGHTLGDIWEFTATVDTFKWSNDNGVTWEVEGVSMTGAAQYLENGLSVTFKAVVGHTLDDAWTAAVTTGFTGTVSLDGTIATDAEVAAGTATFLPISDMSWTAVGIKSLTTQCTHVRGNVSEYTSGSITMKMGK